MGFLMKVKLYYRLKLWLFAFYYQLEAENVHLKAYIKYLEGK